MGDDKATGGAAPKPQPPALPDTAPKGLRDFIACTAASFAFADGPLTWLDVTPKPDMAIKPGTTPGSGTIELKAMGVTIALPATVANGKLAIDTSNQFFLPKSAEDEIQRFVDGLNAWFTSNGKQLAPPTFGPGQMTLTKMPIATGTSTGGSPQPTTPVVPVSPVPPVPPVSPPKSGDGITGPTTPIPYYEPKYVEQPVIPPGEAFGPYAGKAGKPASQSDSMQGIIDAAAGLAPGAAATPELTKPPAMVVGAGGPGGPKAPAGMGKLARYALIALILAALAVAAFAMLGRPQPAVPAASTAPTTLASAAPVATIVPPSFAATAAPGATPNGVANGRFEIVSDTKVTSCHHDYEVAFRVFDSSGNGAVYAGKPVTFQVLDGEVLTAIAGPDGTWTSTVAEDFQKTNSGCFSRLNPEVLTVDGQPAF